MREKTNFYMSSNMQFRTVIESKWECPICGNKGKKWLKRAQAVKCGKEHIKKIHNCKDYSELIIYKRKKNGLDK